MRYSAEIQFAKWVHPVSAVALIALGVWLLDGCIPIPGNFEPRKGERPEASIGEAPSNSPLRLGSASREQVESYLGRPWELSPDGSVSLYAYEINTVSLFWPACFFLGLDRRYDSRYLLLHFDERGTLQSYQVYTNRDDAQRGAGGILRRNGERDVVRSRAITTRPSSPATAPRDLVPSSP
jgi:hypothetical protein